MNHATKNSIFHPSNLLWGDCTAGALVGSFVVLLHSWLADLYALPERFVLLMGIANLAYASYSFSLALRAQRPFLLIAILVSGNIVWGALCLFWLTSYWGQASWLGAAQLLLEGVFVGGLGFIEWFNRDKLNLV